MLKKIDVAHLPSGLNVYVALYHDIKNAGFIREQLLNGNADFEFAFIDAKSILSPLHILAAVFRAVNDMNSGRMKSRNVHSEIVFALSPNNNIAESFRKFGITDQTKDLVVIKIHNSEPESYQKILDEHLQGQPIGFSEESLASTADEALIRKIYKLPATAESCADPKKSHRELELSILGVMALRGAS